MNNRKFILTFTLLLTGLFSLSQEFSRFTGIWKGKLKIAAGAELTLVFNVRENEDKNGLVSTSDSPDQNAFGIPCDVTTVKNDTIRIEMQSIGASYVAKLINDSVLEGEFTQGRAFPLQLKKTDKPVAPKKRPQTPQPPYPYKSEEVIFQDRDKSLQFGGTITIPQGKGPFPAAVMITGSGPQDRDEDILGHKLFAVIADHLTRNGYIILRADDRGVGKSSGDFSAATSEDFASDVSAAIEYLLSRKEVDKKKIGLIGHSEGGMIAPMVANKRNDIDFIILLAAPGIAINDLMTEQNAAVLQSAGVGKEAVQKYSVLYKKIISTLLSTNDTAKANQLVRKEINNWAETADEQILKELDLLTKEKRDAISAAISQAMNTPWFRYFLAYDPGPTLQKLKTKVLALNGEKDIQVLPGSNLEGLRQSLKQGKTKDAVIKELPGLNHLFQECDKCTLAEYGELEQTISPVALAEMSEWLNKKVK